MGVRILHDKDNDQAVLYCSTTDWAFGPVVNNRTTDDDANGGENDHDPVERLEAFTKWLVVDPRKIDEVELQAKWSQWLAYEPEYYARERLAELEKYEAEGLFEPMVDWSERLVVELAALRARFA